MKSLIVGRMWWSIATLLLAAIVTEVLPAAESALLTHKNVVLPTDTSARFFESTIRPLLVKRCHECHSGNKAEGGLRLDSGMAIRTGGDSGPALVPHDVAGSLMVSAIGYESLEMPPDEPLPKNEQQLITRWIAEGAKWPEAFEAAVAQSNSIAAKEWWAAKPLTTYDRKKATSEEFNSSTRIDSEIELALRAKQMYRAEPTDRARLIRRLSYDLLGLPPSPEQIDEFASDDSPDAYRRLVDRMFADPAYGERMARLWLDLVRYSESDGWRQDAYRPQAHRYRQWVVDAFNQGMPYDRFVALQLAGDEIASNDADAAVAVGFLRLGIFEFNQRDAEGQWQNIVDEITDVTADVFLATGMACAKCHDHKFDPISRADYFRLRSVFEPLLFVDQCDETKVAPINRPEVDQLLAELAEIEDEAIAELEKAHLDKFTLPLQATFHKSAHERNSYDEQMVYLIRRQLSDEGTGDGKIQGKIGKDAAKRRDAIIARLKELNAEPYPEPSVLTVCDAPGKVRATNMPGDESGRDYLPGIPAVFGGNDLQIQSPPDSPGSSGRRAALASWITGSDNPIAARVLANRLWQYHFGTGLVASPNDFGSLGSTPSHPELLDYLATRLIESGWNIQAIQKEIVCSETYQQSSIHSQADFYREIDAENRLLWRYPVRRLDAEQYRDSLLVATATLDRVYGGPSVSGATARRSIYLERKRNSSDPMLQLLDAPPGLVSAAQRDETVTAPQALMMLNSPRIIDMASKFAHRVARDLGESTSHEYLDHAHRIVTGVGIDDQLAEQLTKLLDTGIEGKTDSCHVLLNSNAFLFLE